MLTHTAGVLVPGDEKAVAADRGVLTAQSAVRRAELACVLMGVEGVPAAVLSAVPGKWQTDRQADRRGTHSCCADVPCVVSAPQVKMAEDIDFKYPTRRACAWEISHFCKGVPHGHARVIRCLQVPTQLHAC